MSAKPTSEKRRFKEAKLKRFLCPHKQKKSLLKSVTNGAETKLIDDGS